MKKIPRTLSACLGAVAVSAAVLAGAAPASADPTVRDLLDKCGHGTDLCEFRPDGAPTVTRETRDVLIDHAVNCSSVEQRENRTWTDTKGESNSAGVKVEQSMTFAEVFTVSVAASYEHEWNWSQSTSGTEWLTLPPGHIGTVTMQAETATVSGQYEMHFGDTYDGHYYWYVPFTSTSVTDHSAPAFNTREMTPEERATECG